MQRRGLIPALVTLCALLFAAPAFADNYLVKDGDGVIQTFCSRYVSSTHYPCHLLYGSYSGAPTPLSVDASGNMGVNLQNVPAVTATPNAGAEANSAASVGVSSAQALAPGARKYLFVQNVSATASVGCNFGGGTAALNTAGTRMLPPYASATFEESFVPNQAVNCIASAASTPVTIESF
jgi:hypothetical protein